MAEKNTTKKSSYISAKESRRITRFNRRVTKKLEADRANANKEMVRLVRKAVQQLGARLAVLL